MSRKHKKEQKPAKEKKWYSIRTKIALIVALSTLLTICLAWIVSYYVIERVYILHARNGLVKTYESCNEFFSDPGNVEKIDDHEISSLNGYIANPSAAYIFVIDRENFKVYSSVIMSRRVARGIQTLVGETDLSSLEESKKKYKICENTVNLPDDDSDDDKELLPDEDFHTGSYYDLVGILDNGYIVVLRSPVEQLHNDIQFAAKFFMMISLFLVIVEVVIVLLVTHRYSNPIIQMSRAARRMSELDFSVKLPVQANDEIGDLAGSMNELSDQLERSISELKSANLRLSKDIEEKNQMEEMRSEFLSHVSHELKTPLALIQGYSEGIKDGVTEDPESVKEYLDVIIDEASKMNELVKKLIDLNELEFGKEQLAIERFNLTELIQDVINASAILAEKSEADIQFDEKSPKFVWADEFMIEEVVTNYLTNAIHYVKKGGRIRIWYEQKETTVRVNVYDEGEPIAKKDLDKLFIKFYKADPARTRTYGGSGIGLSIVAAIMKSHHKDYGVYNAEDGVVFYFELDTTDMMPDQGETPTDIDKAEGKS